MHPTESNSNSAVPQAAATPSNHHLKPEWLRIPEAIRVFGLCRSTLYQLITAGKIKSTCLRKRGSERGVRLINYDSLAGYVEQAANAEGRPGSSRA